MFDATVSLVANGVRTAAGALLVVVASAMGVVILGRYAGFATAWADEVARIAFVWSASLGAASGTHRGLNFAVVAFADRRKGRVGQVAESLVAVTLIVLCVLMFWAITQSIPVALLSKLPALQVTGAWFHVAIAAFAVLATLFTIHRLAMLWRPR